MAKAKKALAGDGSWGNGTIRERNGRFMVRWREGGRQLATSSTDAGTPLLSRAEAADRLAQIQRRLADGKPGIEPMAPAPTPKVTVGDKPIAKLVEEWVEHRRAFDVRTADEERSRWALHLAAPLSTTTLKAITSKWVKHLAQELVKPTPGTKAPDGTDKQPISGPSAHRAISLLSSFFTWAVEEEYVANNPAAKALRDKSVKTLLAPKSTKVKPKVPLRSWSEVDALHGALSGSVAAWYLLQARCGLRPGEAVAQRWDDVDLDGAKLLVRGQVRHGHYDQTKGGEAREVPLVPLVVAALRAWRAQCPGALVCPPPRRVKKNGTLGSPMGTYLAEKSTSKAMAAAFKATKIKARTPYEAGRVTYATLVGGSGKVSAFTLQKWMGHADVKTTERYVKQQDGLSAGELAALGG